MELPGTGRLFCFWGFHRPGRLSDFPTLQLPVFIEYSYKFYLFRDGDWMIV
jgi:hypothetical protein